MSVSLSLLEYFKITLEISSHPKKAIRLTYYPHFQIPRLKLKQSLVVHGCLLSLILKYVYISSLVIFYILTLLHILSLDPLFHEFAALDSLY